MILFTAVFNTIHSCSLVSLELKGIELKIYLRPLLLLGCYSFFTSMYTSFNMAFLGYTNGPEQVGYYTTSTKLFSVIIAFFTAFTGVMLPRMSSLVVERKMEQFIHMLNKSLKILVSFSIPIIFFSVIYSPSIVKLFSGDGFEGAFTPSRIVMPLILIIGLEQIYVIQVLMPLKKDNNILFNSIIGGGIGILFIFLLVPYIGALGSAITWVLSEITILISSVICVHRYLHITFPYQVILKTVLYYLPLLFFLFFFYMNVHDWNYVLAMAVAFFIMLFYSVIVEIRFLKNEILINAIKNIVDKVV